jgi:hypothetical protein
MEPVTSQVHESVFCKWTQALPPTTLQDIRDTLNEFINDGDILTSWKIRGEDWTQTPYQLIYESVGRDWEAARFFLGLIIWRVMMDRPETWVLKRYPRRMYDVIDLTYFRVSINRLTYVDSANLAIEQTISPHSSPSAVPPPSAHYSAQQL